MISTKHSVNPREDAIVADRSRSRQTRFAFRMHSLVREPRPSVVGGKLTHAINHGYRASPRGPSRKKPERRVDPSTLMSPRIALCTRRYLGGPICLLHGEETQHSGRAARTF